MPSFAAKLRITAAVAVVALGANFGIASADAAQHHVTHKSHARKAEKAHTTKTAKRRVHRTAKVHAKKTVKKVTASVATNSAPQPVGISGNWNLVLDSEFNGSSLNTNVWQSGWYGTGITDPVNSNEDDCYSSNNVSFPGDGTMHLNVTAQASSCDGNTYPYTGSIVTTNPEDGRSGGGFQYSYGVVEAKVYIPANGDQIADWPAVWADGQSWPADGEDDIMEGLGGDACWHFHDPLGGPGGCDKTLTPGWHTFASDWQPGSVTYYYDGHQVGQITAGITGSPMYLILDNTVHSGDPAVADSMQVAYVRVWQQS